MSNTPMTKEELALNIRILANASNINGLNIKDQKAGRQLASKLRKTYSKEFLSSRSHMKVAGKQPVKISKTYVEQLIRYNPSAGWSEMSQTAKSDGYSYDANSIRRVAVDVLGLNTKYKRKAFARMPRT